MIKFLSKNWWWIIPLLIIASVLGYRWWKNYQNKKKDADKPPVGSSQYTNVDSQADPILKKGTSGNKVKEIQILLVAKGQNVGKDGPDGLFWNMTETALKNVKGVTEIKYSEGKKI